MNTNLAWELSLVFDEEHYYKNNFIGSFRGFMACQFEQIYKYRTKDYTLLKQNYSKSAWPSLKNWLLLL